jgi:hypothetical protein
MKAINISLTAARQPEKRSCQNRVVQDRSQFPDRPLRQRTAQRRRTHWHAQPGEQYDINGRVTAVLA